MRASIHKQRKSAVSVYKQIDFAFEVHENGISICNQNALRNTRGLRTQQAPA